MRENVAQRTSDDIHLNVFLQRLVKHRITWRKLSALELYLKLMKDRTKDTDAITRTNEAFLVCTAIF